MYRFNEHHEDAIEALVGRSLDSITCCRFATHFHFEGEPRLTVSLDGAASLEHVAI